MATNPGCGSKSGLLTESAAVDAGPVHPLSCEGNTLVPLDPERPALYFLLDRSDSMALPIAPYMSRWDAAKEALRRFFADPRSTGLPVGLQLFPSQALYCDPVSY